MIILNLIEPKNNIYFDLLDVASEFCIEFYFVIRKDIKIKNSAFDVIERLSPYLIKMKEQSEWPGTKLGNGATALVYYYKACNESIEILKKESTSIMQWVQPILPEDLGFLKDGQPWLINTAHEKMCDILTCSKEEVDRIMQINGLKYTKLGIKNCSMYY